MTRIESQALVLKVQAYRESSALVGFFSAQVGRFTAVFKGYRKRKGVARVEPFSVAQVTALDRGGLATLINYEFSRAYALQGDRLAAGFYVLELISRGLGERQEEPELFAATCNTLEQLQGEQGPERRRQRRQPPAQDRRRCADAEQHGGR